LTAFVSVTFLLFQGLKVCQRANLKVLSKIRRSQSKELWISTYIT